MVISSFEAFVFLLLILCVGYVFIYCLGEDYKLPSGDDISIERTIHYVIGGVFSQLILTMFWITPFFQNYFKMLQENILKISDINIQLFSIVTYYFFISIFFAVLFGFCIKKLILIMKLLYSYGIKFFDNCADYCSDFLFIKWNLIKVKLRKNKQ